MKQNEQKTSSGLKWAIVLLAVLLVLSCAALVGRYVYHTYLAAPAVATVPDNLIEEEPASEPEPESEVSSADENLEEDAAADTENAGKAAEQSLTEGSQQSSAGDTAPVGTTPAQSTVQGQTSDGSSNTGADGGTQATVIELYKGRPDANQKFEVNNMFPGDRVTQYFLRPCVSRPTDSGVFPTGNHVSDPIFGGCPYDHGYPVRNGGHVV